MNTRVEKADFITDTTVSYLHELKPVKIIDAFKLDSEIGLVTANNMIVVGNACNNAVTANLLGNPNDCTEGMVPGKSMIKLLQHANGNVAMLVMGYSDADTRLAAKVIANRWEELSGTEVWIEGTTYSDATISTPEVVVIEE